MRAGERQAILKLQDVTVAYDRRRSVLSGIDLEVTDRCFVGIVGPSGSGKTTLLRALLGGIAPTTGMVWRRPGLRVAYVPQVETVNWNFPVTAGEVVLMARTRRLVPWSSRRERAMAADVLDRLGIGELADRHIRELSGGQQQRVFIARALLADPHVLLMDEPTSGVDVRTRHDVLHLLGELNTAGLAVVVTTHDLNGIAAHLPHVVCLNRRVVAEGPPSRVLVPTVLEETYGAPMHVLHHGGMPIVVDPPEQSNVVPLPRDGTGGGV